MCNLLISIHAPAWGATHIDFAGAGNNLFQSTLPRGERRSLKYFVLGVLHFNPRSRVGSDLPGVFCPPETGISIHAPAWGATVFQPLKFRGKFISIHAPAWGATTNNTTGYKGGKISIHAPAWGATVRLDDPAQNHQISIHAPAWGATSNDNDSRVLHGHFNPRSRVGSDHRILRSHQPGEMISIHAPAWGATHPLAKKATSAEISIHAPAWGATRWFLRFRLHLSFQSTLPRGERRASLTS